QLPPGVLVEGHHYSARVTARSDGFRSDLPTSRSKGRIVYTQNASGFFTR
ncbi:MAG: hypothetical protein K0S65_1417, partial [Labilithrix sp.]|nr:hypothetical protein [Labilithrix sp.]